MQDVCGSGNFDAGTVTPRNLVRLCRRRQDFMAIISEATTYDPPWSDELVQQVVETVLDKGDSSLSVYEAATTDPLDQGHALGVIAEGIAQEDFRLNANRRKKGCTGFAPKVRSEI